MNVAIKISFFVVDPVLLTNASTCIVIAIVLETEIKNERCTRVNFTYWIYHFVLAFSSGGILGLSGRGEGGGVRSREQRQKYLWIRDEVEWKFDGTFIEYEDEAKIKYKLWIYLFHAHEFFWGFSS